MQVNLKYGMTKTMQVQERFRFSDPRFTPWQPNGSGNGKVLDMIINAIYFEQNKEATLFGCVPFELLRQNKETVLSHLHTPRGKIHIRAVMKSEKHCSITLKTDTPGALPSSIRFPEHLVVVEPIKNQVHAVSGNTQNFIVTPLEN